MLKGNLREEVLQFTLDFVCLHGHLRLSSFKQYTVSQVLDVAGLQDPDCNP